MAFKPFNARKTPTTSHSQLNNTTDLSIAYNYAINPQNNYKCIVKTTRKGLDYTYCITDNVDSQREYYLNGIKQGELVISENILDHVVINDAPKCLMLLVEIDIRPTERSLELAAIYGHINVLIAINSLGIAITEDIADIAAQHGRVDILKYIYHTERIIPTSYGLINGILNKHCSVVDFICKLLRKYNVKPRNTKRKHSVKTPRSITPVSPRAWSRGNGSAANGPFTLNLTYLPSGNNRSRSNTITSDDSEDNYELPESIRSLSPLSSLSSLSSLSDRDSEFGYMSSPRSEISDSITPRARSNSWVSNYSANESPSVTPSVTPVAKTRDKSKQKIDISGLQCRVDCIEASCQTGCLHCFDKMIKYNQEYTNREANVGILSKSLHISAGRGHMDVCRKLVKMGVLLTKSVFVSAAKSGNYDLFVWLHEAGCPWSYEVYDTAITHGWKKLADYALENGCGA